MQGNRAYFAFNIFGCFLSVELLTYCFILVKFLATRLATGSPISLGALPIAALVAGLSVVWLLPAALLAFTNCLLATDSIEEAEIFYSLLTPILKLRIYPRKMLLECRAGLADCSFARKEFKVARNMYKKLLEEYGADFSTRFTIVFKKFELSHGHIATEKVKKTYFSRAQLRELMVVETATVALACLALLYVVQSVPDFEDSPNKQLSARTAWPGL
jgi:hypothetical protein